ncbi:hypothetical protein [Maricaulis sp. MIT060901]|uniref:hypothetical protein n=1 Tax=Maricaulis sp. MIT060901 TaxID=3096993 RepID=UPI00399A5CC2
MLAFWVLLAAHAMSSANQLSDLPEVEIREEIVGDFDNDGTQDIVRLTMDDEGWVRITAELSSAGLVEIHSDHRSSGSGLGIETSEDGLIRYHYSSNVASRGNWANADTLEHRGDAFYIVHRTTSWRDGNNPSNRGECDFDLRTGEGVRNGVEVSADIEPRRWSPSTASGDLVSAACREFVQDDVVLSGGFDGDGSDDRVTLDGGSFAASLTIETSRNDPQRYSPIFIGSGHEMALTSHGSIQVSWWHSFGPVNHAPMTATIAYRDGAFRVAGLTREAMQVGYPVTVIPRCDVNFLTGRGEMGGESFTTDLPAITLEEMAAHALETGELANYPPQCGGPAED